MRFARVTAALLRTASADTGRLVVTLDDGRTVTTVRDETVGLLSAPSGEDAAAWTADQYAQETIANELALQGWEVIGLEADRVGTRAGVESGSPVYIVRFLSGPAS